MKVNLILTADWHLRDDTPSCRTDNFEEAQWSKVRQIMKLKKQHNCAVLHAGDLFHHWKPSPYLITKTLQEIDWYDQRADFVTVAGQHDLPQHNLSLIEKSGFYTLLEAGAINWIKDGGNFGQPVGSWVSYQGRKVGVWHHFVWNGKDWPWPDCDQITARQVLKENPEYDLIVTGDYHRPFTYEYKGRILVNCGCLTRQAADYDDHRPRVYLWNAETNTVKPHYLKIQEGVVSRTHIEKREERDKRMDAFIEKLSDEWEVSVSFEENLKRFISSNTIRKQVVALVYKAIET